jgi:hypothetical protein
MTAGPEQSISACGSFNNEPLDATVVALLTLAFASSFDGKLAFCARVYLKMSPISVAMTNQNAVKELQKAKVTKH